MSATAVAMTPRPDVEQTLAGREEEREQTLAKLRQALLMVRESRTIQEAKQIHDLAKAARVYATEHKLGAVVRHEAHAVTVEALRQVGKLLHETERATGGQPYQQRFTGSKQEPVAATLADLGIDKRVSWRAQQLFRLPMDAFARVRDGRSTLDKELAALKEKAETATLWAEIQRARRQRAFENCYVGSFAGLLSELRGVGVTADAVITEPALPRKRLHEYSEFAAAVADVPVVVILMTPGCLDLPTILQMLCEHLTYRSSVVIEGRLIMVFCRDDEDVKRAQARRAYLKCHGWAQFCVSKFTDPGDLVVDPFMTPETALAAIENGRGFYGASTDEAAVAEARRRLEEISR